MKNLLKWLKDPAAMAAVAGVAAAAVVLSGTDRHGG